MRSLILLLFMIASVGYADAQNFVSTTAENKNAVLEEFTGMYCVNCPDGHKRANDFKAANPNDVVLINIHTGGFAQPNPGSGDPDFRTAYGAALANQSQLAGYPAGTINRRHFTGTAQSGSPATATAQSRGTWATTGGTVIGEGSPINVAAQATIDLHSRELEVIVETYFTAAANIAPYKLNVALLQNKVEGPQTGSSANPSNVLPNGNYEHNHMLRHLLTGQWGVDVDSTHMGYFQADTFRYTIPAAIGYAASTPIPAELINMEVAVFVAESQQTILTGNLASMTFTIPPGMSTASTKMTSAATTSTSYCDYNYTPSVVVENNSSSSASIDSFMVSYTFNGGTAVNQLITTPLAAGSSTTVSFPAISFAAGANTVNYNIDFDSYNNSTLIDISSSGDVNVQDGPYNKLESPGSSLPFSYDFQTGYPANSIIDNPNDKLLYRVNSGSFGGTGNIGGFGNSTIAFAFDFWPSAFQSGSAAIWFGTFDMSDTTMDYNLKFNHAYAQWSGSNDRLQVIVSTDCGATWDTPVWDKTGSVLATAPDFASNSDRFIPTATQWDSNTVDLTALYKGESSVTIAFRGISNYGNPAYIDDLNLLATAPVVTSLKNREVAQAGLNIMPNPVRNEMTVQFDLPATTELSMTIYNALGQQVQQVTTGTFEGTNTVQVNTSQLAAGVYLLNLASDKGLVSKRFTVER